MQKRLHLVAITMAAALCAGPSHAQGIPVIDIANLIQTIQQVMNDITKIENQVEQIRQLQNQVASINGVRNLGNVFNSAGLNNYIPANALTAVNAIDAAGVTVIEQNPGFFLFVRLAVD